MYIFNEDEIRRQVNLNPTMINEIENAFTDLATKNVQMPPIMRVDIPEYKGEMDAKSAYIPGYDFFAMKISTGFFDNHKLGLPSTGGLMFLMNATNGQPEAVLHDNGYLTDVRTAAAGAVAADYLANPHVEAVGVIGAGAQGRYQLEALSYVRDFKKVYLYSKTATRAEDFKKEVEAKLKVSVTIVDEAEEAVKNVQILITATPATSPIIKYKWLPQGIHITAMGSDAEHKQELEAEILQKADHVVCDVIKQCEILGELRSALETGALKDTANILELGQLTSEKRRVRKSEDEITVCDLTGTGAQDTKIALYAYEKLIQEKGA